MITFLYQNILKQILFLFDPEFVHDRFLNVGEFLGKYGFTRNITKRLFYFEHSSLEQEILGIKFKNPVGLSAGFDKDARLVGILPSVGFGFEEVGTITNKGYEGNPKPRLVRLKKSRGLIVYYGLKNQGAQLILKRISERKLNSVLNISFSRTNSKQTSGESESIKDICECFKKIVESDLGEFYTLNISCPNTFGGEPFTTESKLEKLLRELTKIKYYKPLFVKMPVDLPWSQFERLLKVIVKYKLDGVTIANLTKDRTSKFIKDEIGDELKGGISGLPTKEISTELIRKTYKNYHKRLTIIGVGGIFSAEDAYEKIKAGASLVELITGMIYQGPQLIGQMNRELVELLQKDGYENLSQAIGSEVY